MRVLFQLASNGSTSYVTIRVRFYCRLRVLGTWVVGYTTLVCTRGRLVFVCYFQREVGPIRLGFTSFGPSYYTLAHLFNVFM